jgi:hypothetical protein
MARTRTTFGKLQRERDKQEKQKAKRDKRFAKSDETDEAEDAAPARVADQEQVMASLARLQESLENGQISIEEFETKRDELTALLQI